MNKMYKIWNKKNKSYVGCYSKSYHMKHGFNNLEKIFLDNDTHEIHEFEIAEKLLRKLPSK